MDVDAAVSASSLPKTEAPYHSAHCCRLMEECGVVMYCDLHAHSRKHNIFIYGCENKRGPDKQLQEQVFPLMLHKNAADKVGLGVGRS